jgi:hypothetical protein
LLSHCGDGIAGAGLVAAQSVSSSGAAMVLFDCVIGACLGASQHVCLNLRSIAVWSQTCFAAAELCCH